MPCSPRSARVSELEVAPARAGDVRALARRRGIDETALRISLELLETGGVWVAHDAGEAIAIAVAQTAQNERCVGDLYVEPTFRGAGVAARLLEAAFGESGDLSQAMLVQPGEAASLALALRRRMRLREPLVRFAGPLPREEELAAMAAGQYRFDVADLDPIAHAAALDELDRRTRGTARPLEHAAFAGAAAGFAFYVTGELVGYAYAWPDGRVGPMACASQAYLVQIFAYALVSLARRHGASWCSALVPGSNVRIARTALRAGLRIAESVVYASDAFAGDLSAYVCGHALQL